MLVHSGLAGPPDWGSESVAYNCLRVLHWPDLTDITPAGKVFVTVLFHGQGRCRLITDHKLIVYRLLYKCKSHSIQNTNSKMWQKHEKKWDKTFFSLVGPVGLLLIIMLYKYIKYVAVVRNRWAEVRKLYPCIIKSRILFSVLIHVSSRITLGIKRNLSSWTTTKACSFNITVNANAIL